jgi:hypothetical protein
MEGVRKINNWGGARPGAGRKKGVLSKKGSLLRLIEKEVRKMMVELAQNDHFKETLLFEVSNQDDGVKDEYFYILSSETGLYKIGYTSSLRNRFKSYQTNGDGLQVCFLFKSKHAYKIESIVIGRYCSGSEWVSLSSDDLNDIRHLCFRMEIDGDYLLNQMKPNGRR